MLIFLSHTGVSKAYKVKWPMSCLFNKVYGSSREAVSQFVEIFQKRIKRSAATL